MIVCNTMHDIIYNVYLIEGHLIQELNSCFLGFRGWPSEGMARRKGLGWGTGLELMLFFIWENIFWVRSSQPLWWWRATRSRMFYPAGWRCQVLCLICTGSQKRHFRCSWGGRRTWRPHSHGGLGGQPRSHQRAGKNRLGRVSWLQLPAMVVQNFVQS